MQLTYPTPIDWENVNQPDIVFQRFPSRRSVVYGTKGMVACSQPLAAEAGLEILRMGGNAGARIHHSFTSRFFSHQHSNTQRTRLSLYRPHSM
jgi:gamma-glutamyltranspeptidase